MTRFNIMFSFDSAKNSDKFEGKVSGTEMLTGQEQLQVYHALKKAFWGTDLQEGFEKHWFKEFTPEFCCSAVNCGDKFFLLQSDGDVYACPRGQASKQFYYGNVFKSDVLDIVKNGWQTIERLENSHDESPECYQCEYLKHCHQGCVFVREETGLVKSYTCDLQKQIYRDYPDKYPPMTTEQLQEYSRQYRYHNSIQAVRVIEPNASKTKYITPELHEDENALASLIAKDKRLQAVYSSELFALVVDGERYSLQSATLNNRSAIATLSESSRVSLWVANSALEQSCNEPVNNYIYVMLLRNTMVEYGEEGRTKQQHLIDYNIYQGALVELSKTLKGDIAAPGSGSGSGSGSGYSYDLTPFLNMHKGLFQHGVRNNLLVTTKALREYHYAKQKNNAFYHIQAINLPFPALEFYWFDNELDS